MTATESLKALTLGASGIFFKHNSPETLIKVIRLVASGEIWLDQKVVHLLAEGAHQREDQRFRKLAGIRAAWRVAVLPGLECLPRRDSQLGHS